jgi:tRNA modification GTPase
MHDQTIIAPSTPFGYSGLAIIRLSGPKCREIVRSELGREKEESHRLQYGRFTDLRTGEVIDSLNFVYMAAPSTSTGEDVLEMYPHGNPLLVSRIIEVILRHPDVRMAGPGEFTRRGLENGKMDLLQAEAVGQLIHAGSTEALRNAGKILNGSLSRPLRELKKQLDDMSVRLELDVDFAEEEADPDYASWKPRIERIMESLSGLSRSWEVGKRLRHEPRAALFGAPNTGKSSLINAMLKQERMIVAESPGTTRDYVEIPVNLESGRILMIDTAGIGDTADSLHQQVMEKTRQVLAEVDYRILLIDGTVGAAQPEATGNYDLDIYTKSDLPAFRAEENAMCVSSKTGQGVAELMEHLNRELFFNRPLSLEAVITSERQFRCIDEAKKNVVNALECLQENPAVEILAFEIREARNRLAELFGEYDPEETLNAIFSQFCIGK